VYVAVGAAAIVLVFSLSSSYLRSQYLFWIIIIAGCVGVLASVWAVLSADTVYWYNAILSGGSFVVFLWTVSKKYSKRRPFFGASDKVD